MGDLFLCVLWTYYGIATQKGCALFPWDQTALFPAGEDADVTQAAQRREQPHHLVVQALEFPDQVEPPAGDDAVEAQQQPVKAHN